jgi:hypothetical protein
MRDRFFSALVLPDGDPGCAVPGPLVQVDERTAGKGEIVRTKLLTRAEAEALQGALGRALLMIRASELNRANAPRAYTGPYPIRGATLAEVDSCGNEEAVD